MFLCILRCVDADARRALRVIRRCVELDRYELSGHFRSMCGERAIYWCDILNVLDEPTEVRNDGLDKWGWPKWAVEGTEAIGTVAVEFVCKIEGRDDDDDVTVFITAYEA